MTSPLWMIVIAVLLGVAAIAFIILIVKPPRAAASDAGSTPDYPEAPTPYHVGEPDPGTDRPGR